MRFRGRTLKWDSYPFKGGAECLMKGVEIDRKLNADEKGNLEISLKRGCWR